ncbi:3-coathanger stack domain-containing protein [Emticicia oligotrophica]|uniref:3-coathanger stack domain-containing protein n=1 Tax=Emticicia oligotrophica TaxID=312279 RepID=UPI00273B5A7C|nr:3-coathanger stack domain-containing protein [Emticicia oligotrophica]
MKFHFIILSFLHLTISAQQIVQQKTTNYISYSSSIDTTENGGVIVGIATGDANNILYPNCITNLNQTNSDVFVSKYDSNHNLIWRACLGTPFFDDVTAIKYLPDSSTIVAYTSQSYLSNLSRISKTGIVLWTRKFYDQNLPVFNNRPSCINNIMSLSHNTILISGFFNRNNGNFGVLKLDLQGNMIWEKYGGGNKALNNLIKTLDGGFMGVGVDYHNFYSSNPSEHISGFCTNFKGVSGNDIMLYKLDSLGNLEWKNCYGGTSNDNAYDIVQLADSSYVFLSGTTSQDIDVNGNLDNNSTLYHDIWLCRVSKVGSMIWSKCFGGSQTDIPSRIFKKNNGNVLICGTTTSYDKDLLFKRPYWDTSSDIWLFEIDASTKEIIWQYVINQNGSENLGFEERYNGGVSANRVGDVVFNEKTNMLNITSTNGSSDYFGITNGWLINIRVPNCTYQKNLNSNIYLNLDIDQANYINTTSIINSNSIVNFTGSNAININQGFTVENGVVFTAKIINECGSK